MDQNKKQTKTIKVEYLARVEGEGSLDLDIVGGKVTKAQLQIFEPPRYFEAFLRGRDYTEAPDITARICGICPIAYQMSAVHAMEQAFGVDIDPRIRELRRLIYCGEWIESHVLHMFMLHAPDFLGFPDSIQMAKQYPNEVKLALKLKKMGNSIVEMLGGREIHPINVKVGGFYRIPDRNDIEALKSKLASGYDDCLTAIDFLSKIDYPDLERNYEFVSLVHPDEYPMNEGDILSSNGTRFSPLEYDQYIRELQVPHSHALHSVIGDDDRTYFVGPLARFNNNFDTLPNAIKTVAQQYNITPPVKNPYKSILVRGIEVLYSFHEAMRILNTIDVNTIKNSAITLKQCIGRAATEAPRGILYHHYDVDADGKISFAQITPPTSQNQRVIEEDLVELIEQSLHLADDELQHRCEVTIRNYDPCISCATHFLKMQVNRQ